MKYTNKGVIYNGHLYEISQADMKWVKEQNKQEPNEHPARNLKSVAHTITEL